MNKGKMLENFAIAALSGLCARRETLGGGDEGIHKVVQDAYFIAVCMVSKFDSAMSMVDGEEWAKNISKSINS